MSPDFEDFSTLILPILTTLLIGGIISLVYYILDFTRDRLKSYFTSSLTLSSSDPLYTWVYDYLIEKNLLVNSLSNVSCKTERKSKTFFWLNSTDVSADSEKPEMSFLPAVGYHAFIYQGVKINIFHESGRPLLTGFERKLVKIEEITLSCLGKGNVKILKSICEEAMNLAINKDKDCTNIYALNWSSWEKVQSKKPRPFHTVILDTNIAEEVIEDIRNFKQNQNWYVLRGVPYRRGYMLYGPPGTGKTSFVLAVAAELKLSICTLNLSGNEMDDERLNKVLEDAPRNSLILLEDIDAIFVERTSVDEAKDGRKVSFSGLLNAIDGVRSQEGRILFMSTNHLEKLDAALLRPGRSDVHVKLDYASQEQIKRMFERFYPDAKKGEVERFVGQIPEKKISMAKLQGHFLRHKNDPEQAVATAKSLFESNEFTNEMSIAHWLFRLNLENFSEGFLKEKIRRVIDLKGLSEGDLEKFGVKKSGDKNRIMSMLTGDEQSKKAFGYMSHQSIRSFLCLFLRNSKEIEELVKIIPDNQITEYHLRDIFEKNNGESYETKLKSLIQRIDNFLANKKQRKDVLKKRYPKETPIKILEDLGMQSYIEKFKEHDVLESEFFYQLTEGNLKGELGVESFGLRKEFMKKITELTKKTEEEEEEMIGAVEELIVEKVQNALKKSGSIQY